MLVWCQESFAPCIIKYNVKTSVYHLGKFFSRLKLKIKRPDIVQMQGEERMVYIQEHILQSSYGSSLPARKTKRLVVTKVALCQNLPGPYRRIKNKEERIKWKYKFCEEILQRNSNRDEKLVFCVVHVKEGAGPLM